MPELCSICLGKHDMGCMYCSKSFSDKGKLIDHISNSSKLSIDEVDNLIDACIRLKVPVVINYNNDTGTFLYAIIAQGTDFWMGGFHDIEDAEAFCKLKGLTLVESN